MTTSQFVTAMNLFSTLTGPERVIALAALRGGDLAALAATNPFGLGDFARVIRRSGLDLEEQEPLICDECCGCPVALVRKRTVYQEVAL